MSLCVECEARVADAIVPPVCVADLHAAHREASCLAEWLYLAPSERLKVDDSRLCVAQLMALFALSELHCVDELSFIAVHRRARRECDTFKFSRLRRTFLCAVRRAELTQCRRVLSECARNKAKARALDVDEKAKEDEDEHDEKVEEDEEGDGDELCADDSVWILTNICDGPVSLRVGVASRRTTGSCASRQRQSGRAC